MGKLGRSRESELSSSSPLSILSTSFKPRAENGGRRMGRARRAHSSSSLSFSRARPPVERRDWGWRVLKGTPRKREGGGRRSGSVLPDCLAASSATGRKGKTNRIGTTAEGIVSDNGTRKRVQVNPATSLTLTRTRQTERRRPRRKMQLSGGGRGGEGRGKPFVCARYASRSVPSTVITSQAATPLSQSS